MADAKEEMRKCFAGIQRYVAENDYFKVLECADQVLSMDANDQDALKTKCVALLRLQKFQDALRTIKDIQADGTTAFWESYCLYQLKENEKALQCISGSTSTESLHLKAQIYYRIGQFEKAGDLLQSIEDSQDVAINKSACSIGRCDTTKALEELSSFSEEDIDIIFNKLCAFIEDRKFECALELIEKGLEIASRHSGEDLSNLLAQKAYVLSKLKQISDAQEIYSCLLQSKDLSESVLAVVLNNMVALKRSDAKIFESSKRIARALKLGEHRVTPKQMQVLRRNAVLVAFYEKQYEKCRHMLADGEYEESFAKVMNAMILIKQKKKEEGEALLKSCPIERAQFRLDQKDVRGAIMCIFSASDVLYFPGTLSSLLTLYSSIGEETKMLQVYQSAISFWKSSSHPRSFDFLQMINVQYAELEINCGNPERAFATLLDAINSNVKPSERMIALYLKSTILAEKEFDLGLLSHMQDLKCSISADELEEKLLVPIKIVRRRIGKEESSNVKKKVTKKKRKPRYPKNFDPANPGPLPDSERWLPRWQRSSKKNKRGQKKAESMKKPGKTSKPLKPKGRKKTKK